jgi:DNA-binding transcriptional regulator YiaG
MVSIIRISDMSDMSDATPPDDTQRRREKLLRIGREMWAESLRKCLPASRDSNVPKARPEDIEMADLPQTKNDLRDAGKVRRSAVGRAIGILRSRLNLSQSQLAKKIGSTVDNGTVSRWERGALLPHPWKRKKLAAIARDAGCEDLAAVFAGENLDWRIRFAASPDFVELSRTLTTLEICTINAFTAKEVEAKAYETFRKLQSTAHGFLNHLLANAKNVDAPLLFDSLQRELWMDLLGAQESSPLPESTDSAVGSPQGAESDPEEK